MTGLRDLKVGDRVQVFDANRRGTGQPEGGWDGTVTKVGRTLLHVVYRWHEQPVTFRLDTGVINDSYGWVWVMTPEQAAEDQRRRALVATLRQAGIDLQHGRKFSTDTLTALAAVLEQNEGSEQ